MFTQLENTYSSPLIYTGSGDYRRDPRLGIKLCDTCDRCVLHIGETVTVESVWMRNAFKGDTMILAYVRGFHTGQTTHVPVGDLTQFIS